MKEIKFEKRFYVEGQFFQTFVCQRGIRLWIGDVMDIESVKESIKEKHESIEVTKREIEIMEACIAKYQKEFK